MNWTKTLQVAQMLTEAIQANVPPKHPTQETRMGDDAVINQDPAAQVPVAQDPTPVAPAPVAPTIEAAPVPEAVAPVAADPTAPASDAVAHVAALGAALGSTASSDINTTLQNAANLAQALHQNPEVLRLMHTLLGKFGPSQD